MTQPVSPKLSCGGTNRKVPDELADVREQIKQLKNREEELRNSLIAGEGADLVGDDWVALVSRVVTERIDTAQLRRELGLEKLRPFLVPSENVVIKLERLKGQKE